MYHDSVLDKLLSYVRKHGLIRAGNRVGVAVSGGADSVALLRLLLEAREQLGIVVAVVHFNHKIRGAYADADEAFVCELARRFDLQFHSSFDDTPAYSGKHKLSLEAAGRALRYAFFHRLTAEGTVDRVATAHTRDDQAETVLMRFLRGAGTKGLAGIYPGIAAWSLMGSEAEGPIPGPCIVRPLLDITRAELRAYLETISQSWREDASNLDLSFARNRLRHEIMPLLRQLNPSLDALLSDTAEIAREEESWWKAQTNKALHSVWAPAPNLPPGATGLPRMRVDALLVLPLALQRRVVRVIFEKLYPPLDFCHVEAVLALAAAEPVRKEKSIALPGGWEAVRQDQELWFRRGCQTQQGPAEYDLPLCVPGDVDVAVVQKRIRAALQPSARDSRLGNRDSTILDPALAERALRVRNWRPGDRYQPAHTAAPRKLKELLQAPHIPRAQKPFWPVVVSGEEIIWIPGFPPPEQFQVRDPQGPALLLQELPLQPEAKKGP